MNPFFVLGLEPDADDAQVAAAYNTLLKRYPPDRDAQRFAAIRSAYEALQSPIKRIETKLFYYDTSGRALSDLHVPAPQPVQKRFTPSELTQLLKAKP